MPDLRSNTGTSRAAMQAALESLTAGLMDGAWAGAWQPVAAADVPPPFDALLVHHEHMTTTLEAYHRRPVELRVLRAELHGDDYRRMIALCPRGSDFVVEVGVARVHLNYTDDEVRRAILAQTTPLGAILIRHNVLRRIEPRGFFRIEDGHPLGACFNRPMAGGVHGRLGVIHCNGAPAIELLEAVCGERIAEKT